MLVKYACIFLFLFSVLLDPEQKLHTIRAHPPVIASWSHYNKAGKALTDFLKEKASTKNVKDIAELGRVFLKRLPERFELQCYLCTIENGVSDLYYFLWFLFMFFSVSM